MKKEKKKKEQETRSPNAPPPLTEEEIAMIKASMASRDVDRSTLPSQDTSDAGHARRFIKKNKVFSISIAVLAVFGSVLIVLLCVFGVRAAIEKKRATADYTFYVGDNAYTVKYNTAVRDGVLYVDMYPIAEYAQLTRSGSKNNVKFTASQNQYLRFEDGSEYAVINGIMVEMGEGVARVNEKVCEIPFSFFSKVIGSNNQNGLRIVFDDVNHTVKIQRRMYETNKKDRILFVEITFYPDSFTVLQSIKRPPNGEKQSYDYGGFDVSDYESNIDPKNASEYLILANKETPLGETYAPKDLVTIDSRWTKKNISLRNDAERALCAMMLHMTSDGIDDVFVTSAYRTYSYQAGLFDRYVNEHMSEGMTRDEAERAALEYSAKPGTSEHQTGLCIDFMTNDMRDLDESFEDTDAFRWLSKNAYKYGFILRYPEDKVDTTGYKYEPWHYRFVGRTAATEIYNSGLCLEEYLELN